MSGNFSALGIELRDPADFRKLAEAAAETAVMHDCPQGRYLQWTGESGAELWLQFSQTGEFLDIQPHFAGQTALRAGVVRRLERPTDTLLDGAWQAWIDPPEDDPQHGRYELLVEAPDFRLHEELALPRVVGLQVAAFSRQAAFFETADDFLNSDAPAAKYGLQSVLPAPEVVRQGGETEPRRALAWITGIILRVRWQTNELTSGAFWQCTLETDGGRFDVLLPLSIVETEPRAGGVLSALCWVSGRIL